RRSAAGLRRRPRGDHRARAAVTTRSPRRSSPSPVIPAKAGIHSSTSRPLVSGSRLSPLSDSQIFGDICAHFDGVEAVETMTHDEGSRLSIVYGPPAETGDDPAREGDRAFAMGIVLALGATFKALRDGCYEGSIVSFEAAVVALRGGSVTGPDELHA